MSMPRTLRPFLRGPNHCRLSSLQQHYQQRRAFLPNPFESNFNPLNANPTTQKLTATRTFSYPSQAIYSIVADVKSYATFLPYCQSSAVTQWSQPDATHARRWPSEARLVVGYGSLTETFTSRVFCVPGRIVESIGGNTQSELPRHDIAHHLEEAEQADKSARGASMGLLTHLRSRWTIEALKDESTEVTLALEFAFANPLYATLSAGAAPKVAEVLVKAFEDRLASLLGSNEELARAELSELEGSRLKRG